MNNRLLIIVADDIRINSSANLCHLAYIRGFIENGYNIDLICAENRGSKDDSMELPKDLQLFTFDGIALYEKLSATSTTNKNNEKTTLKQSNNNEVSENAVCKSGVKSVAFGLKKKIRSVVYGVYGFKKAFVKRGGRFRNSVKYDYVISLSYPQASHLLAYRLIKKHHIQTEHWIQVWEDPWKTDLYSQSDSDEITKEENKLLDYAEKICYVTPLTLINQQKLYPNNAHKMYWLPLPAYYQNDEGINVPNDRIVCGYFGDYYPYSRNLNPFFDAVSTIGVETYICGNPSDLFTQTDSVKIIPRLSVLELKEYEDRVNTLVFLCNLGGGQVPGKIYQYSATKKRILFILDGSKEEKAVLRDYFSQFNRYYFCENTIDSIIQAIKKMDRDESVNNSPVDYFEPQNIAKELLDKAL